jgi:hypothetical protein
MDNRDNLLELVYKDKRIFVRTYSHAGQIAYRVEFENKRPELSIIITSLPSEKLRCVTPTTGMRHKEAEEIMLLINNHIRNNP